MQIMIDIPEDFYKNVQDNYRLGNGDVVQIPIRCIANGTPLPKGHGDLKDVNDLYNHVNGGDYDGAGFSKEYVYCNDIANAPTIIEADEAESETEGEPLLSKNDVLDAFGHGSVYTSDDIQRIVNGLPLVKK